MPPIIYHHGEFPPKKLDWDKLIPSLGPANRAVARYDATLEAIPNSEILLSPLTTQEAVLSSQIEGTVATMAEVLEFEASGIQESEKKKQDIYEIINYRFAIHYAEKKLSELPLSGRLIKETHGILLQGVRGEKRDPGNFRQIQNWIGKPRCTIEEAKFIPIEPQKLMDGITEWEKFIHSNQKDVLVQLAIAHAEFESLHPFLDGNGRIGRMLIPLFLVERKVLSSPNFYMSAYFETNRDEYYDRLLTISREKEWTDWCVFFLKAITEQAELNTKKAAAILTLYNKKKDWITKETHSEYAIKALDFLFNMAIFSGSKFTNEAGIPRGTAQRILWILQQSGLIQVHKKGSGRRPSIYVFPELFNIAEGRKIF